jgi:very-short-patch-repair endonuclease
MKLIAPPSETRIAFPHGYTVKSLLTPSESRFHECLHAITVHRCRILVKPRLADVFQHQKGDLAGFNKVSQKHVDFLICRNDDWIPMVGIELDDDSHERKDRKKRDMDVNAIFASVGLPLLRIHVREIDEMEALVQKLTRAWHYRWGALEE